MPTHIISQAGNLVGNPPRRGVHYFDTDKKLRYISVDTGSNFDWEVHDSSDGYERQSRIDHGTDPANFTIPIDHATETHSLISTGSAITITFAAPRDTDHVYRKILIWEPSGSPTAPILAYSGGAANQFTQGTLGTAWQMVVVFYAPFTNFYTTIYN